MTAEADPALDAGHALCSDSGVESVAALEQTDATFAGRLRHF